MTIQEQIKQNAQKQRAAAAARKKKEEENKRNQQTTQPQQQQTQKPQSREINPNKRSMREVIDELAKGRRQMARDKTGNIRGTMGAIQAINETDPNKADELYSWLQRRSADKSSRYYNAYKTPTNSAVERLNSYGVDTSKIDDNWYKQNAWLKNHYNTSDYTNNPVKPGKRASDEEKAAYEYYQMMLAEEQTKKAEKEQAELEKYLQQEATKEGRTLTDREIVEGINWNKYPTLKNMRKGAETGAPLELNRAVNGSTDDWAYATLWRALNPDNTGSYEADLINSSMGYGNTFERQQEAKRQKEQMDAAASKNTDMWRNATANATYGQNGQNDAWQIYARKQMLDTPGGLEAEQRRLQDYYHQANKVWQQAAQDAKYSSDGVDRSWQVYAQKQMLDTPGGLEAEIKRSEGKREQLSSIALESFEKWKAQREAEAQAAGQPVIQKSDKELMKDWLQDVYRERQNGTWDNGDDPLMMSDEGLRQYQIKLGQGIADIQGTIDEIQRQREDKENWYPDIAMQDWDDLHTGLIEGEFSNGEDVTEYLQELFMYKNAEQIQRDARDYFNNHYQFLKPGDTEEQKAINRATVFDSVFGTGAGCEAYDIVTEYMTPEGKAAFDEALDNIIEDMRNPYDTDQAFNDQIQEAEQQIAALKRQRDNATLEAEKRAQQIALERKAAGMTLNEGNLPKEKKSLTEGKTPQQVLLNGITGAQGDKADRVYWQIQEQQSAWNMMTTEEKMDLLGNLGAMRSGVAESIQNTQDAFNQYYMFMTPEMVDTFNKLYSNGDKDSALAYIEALDPFLKSARSILTEKVQRENAKGKYGAMYGLASVLEAPQAGAMGTAGTFLAGLGNKDAQSAKSDFYLAQSGVNAVRDERGNVWDDALVSAFGEDWRGVGKYYNGIAYSMADNMMAMATTAGLGAVAGYDMTSKAAEALIQIIMSSEATSSAMLEQLKAGKNPTEAAIMAIGGGIIEALTEKYSIENLLQTNVKDMIGDPLQWLRFVGKQWFTEGTEEVASDWLNTILDEALSKFYGHESELAQQARELKENNPGMTDAKANYQVLMDYLRKNRESFAAGAMSGMLMSLGKVSANVVTQNRMGSRISSNTNTNEEGITGAQQLVQAAAKMKEGTQSRAIAEEILGSGEKPGNWKLGQLAQNILYESSEEIGNIARNTVVQEAKSQLIKKGMGDNDAEKAAQIITKAAMEGMESLTDAEMSVLANNQQAIDLLKDFTSNPQTQIGIRVKQIADTAEQRSIRQQVEELVSGKAGQTVSASAKDVADSMENANIATQEDIDAADGEVTGDASEAIYNNTVVKVTKIVKGKAILTTYNGTTQTVDLADLKAVNPTAAAVISMAQNKSYLMSDRYATKVLQNIGKNNQTDAGKYIDDAMKIRLRAYSWNTMPKTNLDSQTAQDLYNEAIAERDEAERTRVSEALPTLEPGKGVATFEGAEYGTKEFQEKIKQFSKTIRNQIGGLSEITVRAGYRVNYINDAEHSDVYGFYDRNTGTITINLAGTNKDGVSHHLLVTAGHEMTHWLEQHSKGGYAALRQFVVDRMRANGENIEKRLVSTIDDFNAVMGESGQTLDLNDAMSEIVANACDQVLGSQAVANELAKVNPSLYNKIKTFVKNFVARIRNAVANMNQSLSHESGLLMRDVEQLAKIWLGAREEALGNQESRTEYSKLEKLENQFSVAQKNYQFVNGLEDKLNYLVEHFDDFKNKYGGGDIFIGQTPMALQKIGLDNKPLVMSISHLEELLVHPKDENHKLTVKDLMEIIRRTNNPIGIIRSKSHPLNSVVNIVDYEINHYPVIAPVQISTTGRYKNAIRIDVNRMSTAHGRENLQSLINDAVKHENDESEEPGFYYWNKNKANFLRQKGLRLPSGPKYNGLIHNLSDNPNFVNIQKWTNKKGTKQAIEELGITDNNKKQHSVRQRDDAYMQAVKNGDMDEAQRMVDEKAEKVFKNSKVRNKDGTLLKMYHGTNAEFNEFRRDMIGSTGRFEGSGFNFTPAEGRASSYGKNVLAGYLNIENPLSAEKKTLTVAKLAKLIREADPTGDNIIADYASNTRDYGKPSFVMRESVTAARNIWEASDNDVDIYSFISAADSDAEGLIAKFESLGYDGLIHYNDNGDIKTAIAFNSNQFKRADPVTYDSSNNPIDLSERFNTKEPDIRYSIGTRNDHGGIDIESESGEKLAEITESGTVTKYSLSSWTDREKKRVINKLKKAGFTEEQITKWIKDIDDVGAIIAANREVLDFKPDRNMKFKKPNGDVYKWTLDASTLCAKRLWYQGTFNAIQKLLPNTPLRPGDLIELANMMRDMGYQTPCGICYVESRRRKAGDFTEEFIANYAKKHAGEFIPQVKDLTTSDGLYKLREEHPEVYKAYIAANNKRGSGSVKPVQYRTDYRGDVRGMKKETIAYLKSIGGLRIQSFSDFETPHLMDMMQAVLDMAAVGLTSQAYTKVPNFAWVFGDTGIKINLSLMGEGTGLDENGNLIFSSKEGMDFEEAMKLRNRYSKNVGTILVGMNDAHILAAMADDRIDFIIPFHKSGWSQEDMNRMKSMAHYEDYQDLQNERTLEGYYQNGNPIYKNVESNIDPLSYWVWEKSGKENAEIYLQECAKRGIIPKFNNFLVDNGDGSYSLQADGSTDGYWKLLIDFKMYDNDGNGAQQEVVQPNINMEQAMRVLAEFDGTGVNSLPVAEDVVKRYVKEYKKNHPNRQYSISTNMRESVDYDAVQYAIASENMDVNRWMLGMNENALNTEQERALLKQYKNLRFDLDVNRMAIDEYQAKLKKLEAKENPSVYDREEMRKIRNQMEIRQAKLDRLEAQIAKVTSTEGYAGMMYKAQKLMNELVNGRTYEEVKTTVEAISKEMTRISSEMDARAERLEELAKTEGVVSAKAYFAKSGLKQMAAKLKADMNSTMANKDIESRLALMALKLRSGTDVTDDVGELANLLMERKKNNAESYILSELRGRTLVLSEAQVKELKARNTNVREAQKALKGSGIRLKTGKTGTLDMIWDELCDRIPSLDREASDLDMLDNLTGVVQNELDLVKQNGWEGDMGQVANMVLANVINLIDKAENIDSTTKGMIDYIRSVAGEAAETAQYIRDLTAAMERAKQRTEQAKGSASAMDRNVGKAIDYFNALTEQSEAAIWRSERAKLIEQMKSDSTEALLAEQQKWKERIEKDKNAREMAAKNASLRREINTVASRMKTRLLAETDDKNIPEDAKQLARLVLSMLVNNDRSDMRKVLNADKKQLADVEMRLQKMAAAYGDFNPDTDLEWLVIKAPDPADNDYTLHDKIIVDLTNIEAGLMEYRNARGSREVTLGDINQALTKVQEAVSEIWSAIQARSAAEIAGRKYMVYELAEQLEEDMAGSKFKGERTGKAGRALNSAWKMVGYGNLTPEYFIKNLKNRTMSLLYSGLQNAEDRSGLEAKKAQDRIAEIAARTGYATWDGQKKQTIKVASGRQIEISTEQLMALYATWIRESNQLRPEETAHLLKGGFVLPEDNSKGFYGRKKSSMRPIRMTEADLDSLGDYLTDQQKEYVRQIVDYMSTDMAALGNEASMKAYGIKKFTEQYYFPIKAWGGVLNKSSAAGTSSMNDNRAMRQSFSKRITNNAQNAIEITDFTPTAMKHIVGMITFNTVGPAVENINKVLNQQLEYMEEDEHDRMPDMENDITYKRNMRAAFQEAYGKNAYEYLVQLMKDVNGGVASGNGTNMYDRLLSAFKKNAVAGSLSVAAQQPLSYIRAAMMINPKYLAQAIMPNNWKKINAEMMKYSGLAVIKQMGKFDMNYGRSMVDYITPQGMETKRQTAGRVISDVATGLPGKMDELTWGRMWVACKLEQAALNPGMDQTSEKFLKQVAARFNELMRRTQVYDSVLVKSENMRNQHPFAKTITSFMAEPTLSINVLADAWQNFSEKGGKANAAKALATFLLSAAMQAAVKAFFSAGRTPDKKKNKEENYLYRLTYNLMNEANPLGLIPGYSNIVDVLKNGELTDNSMSVIAKAKSAIDNLGKLVKGGDELNWYRTVEDSFGQLLQIATDVPAKNAMRDFRAMVNFFSNGQAKGLTGQTYANRETSSAVLKYQAIDQLVSEDLIGLVNAELGENGYQTSKDAYVKRIYNAKKNGNDQAVKELSEYTKLIKISAQDPDKKLQQELNALAKKDDDLSGEEKIEQLSDGGYGQMGQFIIEQYKSGEITRAKAEELYKKENPKATSKDILKALDKVDWEKQGKALADGDKEYTNYTPLKIALGNNSASDIGQAVNYLMKNEYTAKDIRTQVNKWIKERYLAADNTKKVKLKDAMQKAYKALGYTAEDADKTIKGWKKEKESSSAKEPRMRASSGVSDVSSNPKDTTGRFGMGTIDLNKRPVVRNADGSISTEVSMSFYDEDTGKEILIPTVVNGRIVSEQEAIDHYYETKKRDGIGEYLGMFDTWQEADAYAEKLHKRQEWYYSR